MSEFFGPEPLTKLLHMFFHNCVCIVCASIQNSFADLDVLTIISICIFLGCDCPAEDQIPQFLLHRFEDQVHNHGIQAGTAGFCNRQMKFPVQLLGNEALFRFNSKAFKNVVQMGSVLFGEVQSSFSCNIRFEQHTDPYDILWLDILRNVVSFAFQCTNIYSAALNGVHHAGEFQCA